MHSPWECGGGEAVDASASGCTAAVTAARVREDGVAADLSEELHGTFEELLQLRSEDCHAACSLDAGLAWDEVVAMPPFKGSSWLMVG